MEKSDLQKCAIDTAMAIREKLMNYFKGDCIESIIASTNVSINNAKERLQRRSDRWEFEVKHPCVVHIGKVPIIYIEKNPNRIMYYPDFSRSEPLQLVKNEIESFVATYLPDIKEDQYEPDTSIS